MKGLRGLVLDTNGSTHLVAWFYILYSHQAGISQTCCTTTLASISPARHGMVVSNLFCLRSGFKRRGIFCLHPHSTAWPLTSFVDDAARRGTCRTPVATVAHAAGVLIGEHVGSVQPQ